jgi:hypothetical protein
MSLLSFAKLYARNALGVLKAGPDFIDKHINLLSEFGGLFALLTIAVHIILLPLTLTFFAAFKTLFDVVTRSPLPIQDMAKLQKTVSELDDDGMTRLNRAIHCYEGMSNSSQKLPNELDKSSKVMLDKITNYSELVRNELMIQQAQYNANQTKTEEASVKNNCAVPDGFEVVKVASRQVKGNISPLIEDQVIQNTSSFVGACKTDKLLKQKTTILDFLAADKNAGKRMQHVIFNHFFQPKPAPKAQETSNCPNLAHVKFIPPALHPTEVNIQI